MSEAGRRTPRRRQSEAIFSIVAAPSNCSSMAEKLASRPRRLSSGSPSRLERFDAPDHAEAAPGDLVRARVPAHVVRSPRAVDEHRAPVVTGPEPVRDAGPGGRATTCPGRSACSSGSRRASRAAATARAARVAVPSRMTKISSSSEWQCGTTPRLARREPLPVEACELGALRSVASGAVTSLSPRCSSSTSSTLTMFSGRGAGSPTSSGRPAASTSHGSSSRPSTHGQPIRIARERGSQPISVGWRVPKTR